MCAHYVRQDTKQWEFNPNTLCSDTRKENYVSTMDVGCSERLKFQNDSHTFIVVAPVHTR